MKNFNRRIFAAFAALCSLMTTFSVSATYVVDDGVIPESGLLYIDDFEAYDDSKYQSVYNSRVVTIENYGRALATIPVIKENSASAGLYINLNTLGYDKDYTTCIRNGQVLISQEICVPSHSNDGTPIVYDDNSSNYYQYLMNYSLNKGAKPGTYSTADWSSKGGIFYAVHYSTTNPWIGFNKSTTSTVAQRDSAYVVDFDPDTWHKAECCIDYDNLKISYYFDGEYLGDLAAADAKTAILNSYGLFQLQISAGGTFVEGEENPEMYFDNYGIQIMKAGSFAAELCDYGDNYVDIKCNYSIDKTQIQRLSPDSVKLMSGDKVISADGFELITSDVLRIRFNTKINSDGVYNLVIGDKSDNDTYIRSIYGETYGSVAPGAEFSFIPQEADVTENIDLINLSFDDIEFPTEETSADFDKFVYVRGRKSEEYDFVEDFENTYKYCVSNDDEKGGKLLELKLSDTDGATNDPNGTLRNFKAVRFPFADNRAITGGNIYIDFDAGLYANGAGKKQTLRLMFGLDNSLSTERQYVFSNESDRTLERWSNSSCFLGLSYWTEASHALTPASSVNRTRMTDWQRENNGSKTENQIMLINDDSMHHYSININASEYKYSVSVDGGTPVVINYMPGSEHDIRYDAFVMSLADPICKLSANARIDNLVVKVPKAKTPNIEKVSFFDINGSEIPYSSVMTSKTAKIQLKFNQPVELFRENFVLNGLDEEDYTVEYGTDSFGNDSASIIDFKLLNCLNKDSNYTLSVSSGTVMTESGNEFGRDFKIYFKRAADFGLEYFEPIIDMSAGTVSANVMNLTVNDVSGYVTIIAYKNNGDIYEPCGMKYNAFEVASNTVENVIDDFNTDISDLLNSGASRIGVYVFDDLDSLKLNNYTNAVIPE